MHMNLLPLLACVISAVLMLASSNSTAIGEDSATTKAQGQEEADGKGWTKLFDGKSFGDWKANESKDSWSIKNGALVAKGPRSHLFYMGKDNDFKNFELKVDVMTRSNSNGGIYFHTRWQDEGWPARGYECQVNVSHRDPVKTGSIYNTVKIYKKDIEKIIQDDKWWTQHIIVKGRDVTIKLNGKTVIKYREPVGKEGLVKLSSGTFALQAHDPESVVYFKNIRVKRLPDELK